MAEVISVSALNRYVKNLLDVNDVLFDLALRGEIANFVQNARSGHCAHRGCPFGRHTVAPRSMRAWL